MSGLIAEAESARDLTTAWLVPVSGPPIEPLVVHPSEDAGPWGAAVLGRGETATIRLPVTADKVSRAHCKFIHADGEWTITDASRWGTFVNGVKLDSGRAVVLREGDRIRVTPWTFAFSTFPPAARGVDLTDDTSVPQEVRAVDDSSARMLAAGLSDLLTEATEVLHSSRTERELADALISYALRGTGMTTAALLKVVDNSGRVEPVSAHLAPGSTGQPLYSRSLVARARQGQVAELRVDAMSGAGIGESVMQMKISAAICAPLLVGDPTAPAAERVSALLYLDSRNVGGPTGGSTTQANAAGFVMALARIGSLSLDKISAIEMARRFENTEAEIKAASKLQKLILPGREGRIGPFYYHGESRPGTQGLGGDFFDVVPVGEHKIAVALGDVTGKGISASVLMTASFGFLHALLEAGHPVSTAANMLTRFLHPRASADRFVTLWVGLFDLEKRLLTYTDCGHGWAAMCHADGTFEPLDGAGGPPCGITEDLDYGSATVEMRPGSRAMILSDGFVEQQGLTVDPTGKPVRDQWGMAGVKAALKARPAAAQTPVGSDDLKHLYDSLIQFAGTTQLSDDATAILVKWD